ncbi:MAG: polysaccharide-degrading enzyme, partial [Fibrobacterota bacterium]
MKTFRTLFFASIAVSHAAHYEIGPGRAFTRIADVPIASLKPGDTVTIHSRPEPYREKFVLSAQGTKDAPIVIRGSSNATD